jgi:hypothetical protein
MSLAWLSPRGGRRVNDGLKMSERRVSGTAEFVTLDKMTDRSADLLPRLNQSVAKHASKAGFWWPRPAHA